MNTSVIWKFSLMLFISSTSFANLLKPNQSCTCHPKIADPYEFPQAFNFGKFLNQCIDSCRFRPVHIVADDPGNAGQKKIKLANILHFGSFYKAEFPLESIDNVSMGFEEFRPGVFHIFLKFNLKKNEQAIILVDQSETSKPQVQVQSLVLSSEGVPPKDRPYSLFESFFENYVLAIRMVTGEEMYRWTEEFKHPLKEYSLKLTPEISRQVFRLAVETSQRRGLENVYSLFKNNCSTTAIGFIDSAIQNSEVSSWLRLQESLPISGPFGTLSALTSRGLIEKPEEL